MFPLKKTLSLLLFLSLLCSACANEQESEALPMAEEDYYVGWLRDDGDAFYRAARENSGFWSDRALVKLTEDALVRPDGNEKVKELAKLWKARVKTSAEEETRRLRQYLGLAAGYGPDKLLADGEEADSFFVSLHAYLKDREVGADFLYSRLSDGLSREERERLLALGDYPVAILDWFSLQEAVDNREYSLAYPFVSSLEQDGAVPLQPGYYRDAWRVVASHPDRWFLLEQWEKRGRREGAAADILFYAGLAYRAMGSHSRASSLFEEALSRSPGGNDRLLWYMLDCREKAGGEGALLLADRIAEAVDKTYFDDLFDRVITDLVFRADWEALLRLSELPGLSPYVYDRLDWICARAARWGVPELSALDEDSRYGRILSRNRGGWYNLAAQVSLGRGDAFFAGLPRESGEESVPGTADRVMAGFLLRDMDEAALLWYERYRPSLTGQTMRLYSHFLKEKGEVLESIRVMGYVSRREGYRRNREDLLRLYPLDFVDPIEYWCREYRIPPDLFKALVKTESGFDRDIVSYAGAVGLSQLMPATAEERLALMDLPGDDLTDPETNIAVGANYMNWLYQREYIGNHVQATAAYNGGPGSVRKWNRAMGHYPEALYMEGIPYIQTREYVRSLMWGAVIYGELYRGKSAEATLVELMPETFGNQGE